LGIEGNDRLLLTGISGIIGPVVCAIAIFFIIDRVGRKGPLIVGSLGCAMAMAILAAIVNNFGPDSSNRTALRVGVAMPFVFSVFFSFSFGPISWIYSNELWTTRTRSIGVAAATCSSWAANVLFGQTGSIGIADAGWSFYIAFVVFGVFDAVIICGYRWHTFLPCISLIARSFYRRLLLPRDQGPVARGHRCILQ
jgi:MFS family permease